MEESGGIEISTLRVLTSKEVVREKVIFVNLCDSPMMAS